MKKKNPDGVRQIGIKVTFTQEKDSCADPEEDQFLEIETHDAGGGNYLTIKTKRWAIDEDGIDAFAALLKKQLAQCESYFEEVKEDDGKH